MRPDALHDPEAIHSRAHEYRQKRTGKPHRPADDTSGKALAPGIPLLGEDWMDGYRNAVPRPAGMLNARKNIPALPPGSMAAAKKPPHSNAVPPQPCAARAVLILQKTADHASHAKAAIRIPKA